jgi:ankyrin repeat protein
MSRYLHVLDNPREALFHAAAAGSVKMVSHFLASGKEGVNWLSSTGMYKYCYDYPSACCHPATVLSVASNPEVIQMLLDAKADVNPVGSDSVLRAACDNFHFDAMKLLLDAKANVNPVGYDSLLRVACKKFHLDAVKMLLEAGASANGKVDDVPLLGYTIMASHTDEQETNKSRVINLLLDAGAMTRSFPGGRTILHEVYRGGYIVRPNAISLGVSVLKERDPGLLEARDDMGNTPLLFMVDEGSKPGCHRLVDEHLERLIKVGADPTACDVNGATALMKVMKYKSDCTRKYILTTLLRAVKKRSRERKSRGLRK